MKILFINAVCGTGSTGRICAEQAEKLEKEGNECRIAYGRHSYVPEKYKKFAVRIGNDIDVRMHAVLTRPTDRHGFYSIGATKRFLKWADEYNPEVLWLHNIHGYFINIQMLFEWIKSRPQMEVKWTLHDCWAFTGHCSYFTMVNCDRWKKECDQCPQRGEYPASFRDNSCMNYYCKRQMFTGIKNMTLITPSIWLKELVLQSFLKDYPVEVQYNTINTEVFAPTASDFREKHEIGRKTMVLGVASLWDRRKGLGDMLQLAEMLGEEYKVVLVGLTKKQFKNLPSNVIGIKRTNSPKELAEIYSAADVFINPTYEDNYPTVNLEARACQTPIITYKTGGSPESAGTDAVVIEVGQVYELYKIIVSREYCNQRK